LATVRIKQSTYFAIYSASITAEDLQRRIGLEPDRVLVRGSRMTSPPRPVSHAWQIRCDEPGLTVDEQIARVTARLAPYRAAIRNVVVDANDANAMLRVVRYLGAWLADDEGEEEETLTTDDGLEKLPGQHQLLGWSLDRDVIEFLLDVGAELDVDEYG
jgi:hypothetical protein